MKTISHEELLDKYIGEKGNQNLTIQTIIQIMNALNTKFKFRFEIEEEVFEVG